MAAGFAVKAFTKDKSKLHVHLLVDNKTVVAQVNKMGGGGEVRQAIPNCTGVMGSLLGKSDHTYSLPFTRDCKRSNGQAVSGIHRFQQFDAGQINF